MRSARGPGPRTAEVGGGASSGGGVDSHEHRQRGVRALAVGDGVALLFRRETCG